MDPEFIEHPGDKTAISGETVNFTCSARSSPANVKIKWFLNDTFFSNDEPRFNVATPPDQREAGSTISRSTLTVNDVTGFDSSQVTCRIADNSETYSNGAKFDVLGEQERGEKLESKI